MGYQEWMDIVFIVAFSLQIIFNLCSFVAVLRRKKRGKNEFIIILVVALLTLCLIFRLVLTVYQTINKENMLQTELYRYVYFEFPYHLFNVVAYIVVMQWVQLWAIIGESHSEQQSKFRKMIIHGYPFYFMLYGVIAVVIVFLIVDTIFCSVEATYSTVFMDTLFQVFTIFLLIFGLFLLLSYVIIYILVFVQFRHLENGVSRTINIKMNLFFILMIILLTSRTVYYIVFRFGINFNIRDKEINSDHLIFIYIEEIIFNFVIFYNIALKKNNDEHFEEEINNAQKERQEEEQDVVHDYATLVPHLIQVDNSFSQNDSKLDPYMEDRIQINEQYQFQFQISQYAQNSNDDNKEGKYLTESEEVSSEEQKQFSLESPLLSPKSIKARPSLFKSSGRLQLQIHEFEDQKSKPLTLSQISEGQQSSGGGEASSSTQRPQTVPEQIVEQLFSPQRNPQNPNKSLVKKKLGLKRFFSRDKDSK